jgi:hypothetical protein
LLMNLQKCQNLKSRGGLLGRRFRCSSHVTLPCRFRAVQTDSGYSDQNLSVVRRAGTGESERPGMSKHKPAGEALRRSWTNRGNVLAHCGNSLTFTGKRMAHASTAL